jgi:ribosomal protein L44E
MYKKNKKHIKENIREKLFFKGNLNNPEKLINFIEEKFGYTISKLLRELINGERSIESINSKNLEIIKKYALINSENELYNFIDNYLKLANGYLNNFKSLPQEVSTFCKIEMNCKDIHKHSVLGYNKFVETEQPKLKSVEHALVDDNIPYGISEKPSCREAGGHTTHKVEQFTFGSSDPDKDKVIFVNEEKRYKVISKNNKLKIIMMNENKMYEKKLNEETKSTQLLLKYNFEPTEFGWLLKGKNLVVFGGIKGLESIGFRKKTNKIIIGPDGSKFQYEIEDSPEKKLILKQINEDFDEIEYGIDDNYFIDLFFNLIPNRNEIMMYYNTSKGDIDKTLNKLTSFNPSWRKIIDKMGIEFTKRYLMKLISEFESEYEDEREDYT